MAKSKIPRDPNAPKRNLSAYLLYQNGMRDTFKSQYPNMSFGELSKHTSRMYSQLTAEEKHSWQARAEADKARYLNELSNYTPPPGYDASGSFILRAQFNQSKKKERDPNAPKRNLSAYLLYQNAMREQFKRDNPGMTFGQLSKYTSHMYKSLTFEEKSAWEFRAEQDKRRFEDEMKVYVPPRGYDYQGNLLLEFKMQRKNNRKAPKDPNAPKRARGSYVLFTFDYRPKIMVEHPGIKFTDLGTILGQKWRALSPEERKHYDEMAQNDKMRFATEMDLYKSQKEQQNQAALEHYQNYMKNTTTHNSYAAQMGMFMQNMNEAGQSRIQFNANGIPNQTHEASSVPSHNNELHQYDAGLQNHLAIPTHHQSFVSGHENGGLPQIEGALMQTQAQAPSTDQLLQMENSNSGMPQMNSMNSMNSMKVKTETEVMTKLEDLNEGGVPIPKCDDPNPDGFGV